MSKVIGIDLGTSNSVVAIMETDPKILTNASGSRTTPSVVAFTDKNEIIVGQVARHQQVTNPKNTIYSIKRFMGRQHKEVETEEKEVSYKISDKNGSVSVVVHDKEYTPPEISAIILRDLKKTAEEYLGTTVSHAVITVPAYFNDTQRQATKNAGEIAGLKVERIINEPTAAALAYGLEKKKNEKIAVFDLGGGTFDISILDIGDNVFEVLSTSGDTHLGGDDFDEELVNYIADEFKKKEGIDLRKDPMALQRVKEACEKAKCELSTSLETSINLPYLSADQDGPKHLQESITRAKFEHLISGLTSRTRNPVLQALKDADLTADEIDEIVLVGGSTRIPAVQQIVKDLFGKEPNKSINPDEVVAAGACIQGAILAGEQDDIVLLDVTPLSLGVETLGNIMTTLIDRNTTIPTSKSETFSTAQDNQPEVTVHVLQGERSRAEDNKSLGRFNLTGITPAPRGMPQIEVTFDIDTNGILNVSAKDKATSKEQSIRIEGSGGLDKDEIERMKKEAEEHSEDDKKYKEMSALRNQADQIVYSAENSLKEHGDKISPEIVAQVEGEVGQVKQSLEGDDIDALKKSMEQLSSSLTLVGTSIYEAQKNNNSPEGEPNIVDAEVKSEE